MTSDSERRKIFEALPEAPAEVIFGERNLLAISVHINLFV